MKTCIDFFRPFLLVFLLSFVSSALLAQTDYSKYVDPFIGTGGHGHTFPGATVPFGMVQCSPDTRIDGSWDGCGGYHYSDSVVYGFSHTHLSGTGVSDYGDILISPLTRKPEFSQATDSDILDKKTEEAHAAYYSVHLKKSKVKVEITATERCGIQRYSFQNPAQAGLLIDLFHRDKVIEQSITIKGQNRIEGYRISEGWARKQVIYFVMEFSEPFSSYSEAGNKTKENIPVMADGSAFVAEIKSGKLFLKFKNHSKPITVKTALSSVSTEGAAMNLKQEALAKDFETIREESRQKWNRALSVIEVSAAANQPLKIFYTALYHCLIVPNIYSDVDGSFRGMDGKIYKNPDRIRYTVFSLWDTFRAAHPLYNLIAPDRNKDFILSFLDQYKEGGRLPVWELSSNETDCMIGYHSVSVITDALVKGISFTPAQKEELLQAMIHSANRDNEGLNALRNQGFIGTENESESVSKTLEYAYDDWCIAKFTEMVKGREQAMPWYKRSMHYRELLNPESKFMQPRFNGGWLAGFDPREVNNHFTEANSWQYSFFVPQDVNGLIQLHGGKEKFIQKLDELFSTNSATTGRTQSDITGLIGQYAHGNEPSHHMAYLYAMAGAPHKTQQKVRYIMDEFYKAEPDGLIGNEDCGQMSAWLVMSAMGIYPVCPGSNAYILGTPWFSNITLHLPDNKVFHFLAPGISAKNFYPSSTHLNGVRSMSLYLPHEEIMKGGEIKFSMAAEPQLNYVYTEKDFPPGTMPEIKYLRTPIIQSQGVSFRDKQEVSIQAEKGLSVYFRKSEKESKGPWVKYTGPFFIEESMQIDAYVKNDFSDSSYVVSANFIKRPNNYTIRIKSKYNPQYNAGGDDGLLDGIRGSKDWRKGYWQGYQGQDFEAVVDLGSTQKITNLKAGFLQDQRSWIMMPKMVKFYGSADGKNFILLGTQTHQIKDNENENLIMDFEVNIPEKEIRYLKLVAENYGKLPSWHPGAGGEAFIFVDEIMLR